MAAKTSKKRRSAVVSRSEAPSGPCSGGASERTGKGEGSAEDKLSDREALLQVVADTLDFEVKEIRATLGEDYEPVGPEAEGAGDQMICFECFSEALELIDELLHGARGDFETVDVSDFGVFLKNHGDAREQAEGFLALMPIVKRVYARMEPQGRRLLPVGAPVERDGGV